MAFNTEEGIEPYINIIIIGMTYGYASTCDDALDLLITLIELSNIKFFYPFVMKLVGCLIRILNY